MSMRTLTSGLLVGLISLLLSACTATSEDTTTTTTTDETTTTNAVEVTTTVGDTTTPVVPIGEFTDSEFKSENYPATGDPVFLTSVDVEAHEDFDRVVFHLDGEVSDVSYQIEPVTAEEIESPEGTPIEVDGQSYYEISMAPASGVDLSGETPVETYIGPDSFIPEVPTSAISELAITEDFEGLMSWVVGVDEGVAYAHSLDTEAGELIVDFTT